MTHIDNENVFIERSLGKYKEHERETRRARRVQQAQRERQMRYEKKLQAWLEREEQNHKTGQRPQEGSAKDATTRVSQAIKADLEYDSAEEKRQKKRDIKAYQRQLAERRRVKEKERQEDELDRRLEQEELAEAVRKAAEIERVAAEKRKRDEEIKERMKLKKFIEMREELERQEELEKIAKAEKLAEAAELLSRSKPPDHDNEQEMQEPLADDSQTEQAQQTFKPGSQQHYLMRLGQQVAERAEIQIRQQKAKDQTSDQVNDDACSEGSTRAAAAAMLK